MNRGPKPRIKETITPLAGLPNPPAYLGLEAKEKFTEMATLLNEAGILSLLDSDALVIFCTHFARWRQAEDKLASYDEPAVVTLPNKCRQVNPYLTVANDALKAMRSMLNEFGLSPLARVKLQLPEPDEEDDRWSDFS